MDIDLVQVSEKLQRVLRRIERAVEGAEKPSSFRSQRGTT